MTRQGQTGQGAKSSAAKDLVMSKESKILPSYAHKAKEENKISLKHATNQVALGVAPPPNERSLTNTYEPNEDDALRMDDSGVRVPIEIPRVTPCSVRRKYDSLVLTYIDSSSDDEINLDGQVKELDTLVTKSTIRHTCESCEGEHAPIATSLFPEKDNGKQKRNGISILSDITAREFMGVAPSGEGIRQPHSGITDSPFGPESASIAADALVKPSSRNLISLTDMMTVAHGWAYIGDGDYCQKKNRPFPERLRYVFNNIAFMISKLVGAYKFASELQKEVSCLKVCLLRRMENFPQFARN
ncbi:hypothetical protein QYF36_001722 [Acer negundo]|nr:hypothetical protein QYF36_001722 [Acer negundo]